MTINGMPAHPLLVHLVVILLPLTSVAAIVASFWPAAQRKLTFLIPLGAIVGAVAVPVTVRAGNELAAKLGDPPFLNDHREFGEKVLPFAIALAVTSLVQWAYLRRPDPAGVPRIALAVLVTASAVGTAAIVVLTGDSGAQAVWGTKG
jgi:hypothetical protein